MALISTASPWVSRSAFVFRRDVANDSAAGDAQLLGVELKET